MCRVRRKDGIEIQTADAQGGQIVQLFADAGQVAPKTFPVGHGAFPPGGLVGTALAAAEPVGEDLVPDSITHPGRGRRDIGWVHPGLVKARRDGKTVFYSLADQHVKTILDQGLEHIRE